MATALPYDDVKPYSTVPFADSLMVQEMVDEESVILKACTFEIVGAVVSVVGGVLVAVVAGVAGVAGTVVAPVCPIGSAGVAGIVPEGVVVAVEGVVVAIGAEGNTGIVVVATGGVVVAGGKEGGDRSPSHDPAWSPCAR